MSLRERRPGIHCREGSRGRMEELADKPPLLNFYSSAIANIGFDLPVLRN